MSGIRQEPTPKVNWTQIVDELLDIGADQLDQSSLVEGEDPPPEPDVLHDLKPNIPISMPLLEDRERGVSLPLPEAIAHNIAKSGAFPQNTDSYVLPVDVAAPTESWEALDAGVYAQAGDQAAVEDRAATAKGTEDWSLAVSMPGFVCKCDGTTTLLLAHPRLHILSGWYAASVQQVGRLHWQEGSACCRHASQARLL